MNIANYGDITKYGDRIVVGVSGGKDSTATALHLLEQGYSKNDFDRVFIDVGWEHPKTYEYLEALQETIGEITVISADIPVVPEHADIIKTIEQELGHKSAMVRYTLKHLGFPRRIAKWCTSKLKIKPLAEYYKNLDFDPVNVVGIRKEESKWRAKLTTLEWVPMLDCFTYRPILDWTLQDVIQIHKRFNLAPNPLYLDAASRVGCYPCINANKKAIKMVDKKRASIIATLEEYLQKKTGKKNTFFHEGTIQERIEWSKTARGGKQYTLFDTDEKSCVKWGLCHL